MSRIRALFAIVVLSFAFSAAACSDPVSPQASADTSGPNISRTGATVSH